MEATWVSAIITFFTNIFNLGNKLNEQAYQREIDQRNFEWNQQVTQEQWRRDDTKIQRSVEDAKAAGLSPLAGVDNVGATTMGLAAPPAGNSVVPSIDPSMLLQSFIAKAKNDTDIKVAEINKSSAKDVSDNTNDTRYEETMAKISAEIDQTLAEIASNEKLRGNELAQKTENDLKTVQVLAQNATTATRHQDEGERLGAAEAILSEISPYGGKERHTVIVPKEELEDSLGFWRSGFQVILEKEAKNMKKSSISLGLYVGGKGGTGSSTDLDFITHPGSKALPSFGTHFGKSTDKTEMAKQNILNWIQEHPYPVAENEAKILFPKTWENLPIRKGFYTGHKGFPAWKKKNPSKKVVRSKNTGHQE